MAAWLIGQRMEGFIEEFRSKWIKKRWQKNKWTGRQRDGYKEKGLKSTYFPIY